MKKNFFYDDAKIEKKKKNKQTKQTKKTKKNGGQKLQ